MMLAELDLSVMPRFPDLAGKVALVTGGSKGIGATTARAFAANEVKVAVNGRETDSIDELVDELRAAGAEAIGISADASLWTDIERMRERIEDELGPLDILAPFAGGFGAYTPVQDITEEEWHSVLDNNLTATFLAIKSFLPGMIERGSGTIVTMASNAGRHLDATLTASYAASKAGIIQLTRHVAREVGEHGIRVNCVAPGTTTTERIQRILTDEGRAEIAAKSPLGRLGRPEECAYATLFLASEAAAGYLTGTTLDISGGRIML
jgi:3-oxoacyl-[acyl-carrier protein] reductase